MFGPFIDYWLLRPLVHSRNLKTVEDLDAFHSDSGDWEESVARARVRKLIGRLGSKIDLRGTRLLDVGCGLGDLALALLLEEDVEHVTGIDNIEWFITKAKILTKEADLEGRASFRCVDVHDYRPERPFDVVLSHEALEHIERPQEFLERLTSLVRPGGLVVLAFGPLFHSPFGDHMNGFFRVRVPWRGLLFNRKAILQLRARFFRVSDEQIPDRWPGLNLMRYTEFLQYIDTLSLQPVSMVLNPQLRRIPILDKISATLCSTPVLRDYVTMSVYAVLRTPNR